MRGTPNRNAWIWVAIAALALAASGSAGADFQSARACAQPVIAQLFAGAHPSALARGEAIFLPSRGLASRALNRPASRLLSPAGFGALSPAFPILFVGLLLPLALVSPVFARSFFRVPSAPPFSAAFQRPPPFLLG